jgi:hypothetical protein
MDHLRGSLKLLFNYDRAHLIVHVDPERIERPDAGFVITAPVCASVYWNDEDQLLGDDPSTVSRISNGVWVPDRMRELK